jgi:hypothetical protein
MEINAVFNVLKTIGPEWTLKTGWTQVKADGMNTPKKIMARRLDLVYKGKVVETVEYIPEFGLPLNVADGVLVTKLFKKFLNPYQNGKRGV